MMQYFFFANDARIPEHFQCRRFKRTMISFSTFIYLSMLFCCCCCYCCRCTFWRMCLCIHIILLSSVNFLALLWSRHSVHFVIGIYAPQTPRQKSIWIIEKAFWSQYLWTSISYVWNRIFDGITFRNMHSHTSICNRNSFEIVLGVYNATKPI